MQSTPEMALKTSARFSDTPARLSTAKSPISWGSSWQSTAMDVPKPVARLEANEAPMATSSATFSGMGSSSRPFTCAQPVSPGNKASTPNWVRNAIRSS